VVDSLVLSDEPGHYFTRIKKELISKLKDLGINVNLLDTIPHSRSFWPNYNSKEKKIDIDTSDQQGSIIENKNNPREYVWYTYMGQYWLDHWASYDASPGFCGYAWWDVVSGGGWGVWCAEGGYTCTHPGPYDCSMDVIFPRKNGQTVKLVLPSLQVELPASRIQRDFYC